MTSRLIRTRDGTEVRYGARRRRIVREYVLFVTNIQNIRCVFSIYFVTKRVDYFILSCYNDYEFFRMACGFIGFSLMCIAFAVLWVWLEG